MSTYDTYKDSGISWLGQIPSHWDVKRAKVLFNKENRPVLPNDEVVTCFRDGQVTLRKNRRTEGFTESLKEIGYQGVRKGDLVIHQMDAFAGATGVSDSNGKGTPVYHVCTPKTDYVNNYYYAHIVRRMGLNGYIQSLYRGIRERSSDFRFDVFGRQFLPVPPLAEQNAIVAYLDSATAEIDKAIASQQRMVELLQERKQIIINQAVTQGLNPDAPMKPTNIDWLPQIPAHWNLRRMKYSFLFVTDKSNPDEKKVCLEQIESWTGKFLDIDVQNDGIGIRFKSNDILFGKLRPYLAKVHLAKFGGQAVGDIYVLRCMNLLNSEYAQALLISKPFIDHIDSSTYGTKMPRTNWSFMGNVYIPIPPLAEQRSIVDYIGTYAQPINSAIAHCQQKIELLTERKQILINDVVTGKIKVS